MMKNLDKHGRVATLKALAGGKKIELSPDARENIEREMARRPYPTTEVFTTTEGKPVPKGTIAMPPERTVEEGILAGDIPKTIFEGRQANRSLYINIKILEREIEELTAEAEGVKGFNQDINEEINDIESKEYRLNKFVEKLESTIYLGDDEESFKIEVERKVAKAKKALEKLKEEKNERKAHLMPLTAKDEIINKKNQLIMLRRLVGARNVSSDEIFTTDLEKIKQELEGLENSRLRVVENLKFTRVILEDPADLTDNQLKNTNAIQRHLLKALKEVEDRKEYLISRLEKSELSPIRENPSRLAMKEYRLALDKINKHKENLANAQELLSTFDAPAENYYNKRFELEAQINNIKDSISARYEGIIKNRTEALSKKQSRKRTRLNAGLEKTKEATAQLEAFINENISPEAARAIENDKNNYEQLLAELERLQLNYDELSAELQESVDSEKERSQERDSVTFDELNPEGFAESEEDEENDGEDNNKEGDNEEVESERGGISESLVSNVRDLQKEIRLKTEQLRKIKIEIRQIQFDSLPKKLQKTVQKKVARISSKQMEIRQKLKQLDVELRSVPNMIQAQKQEEINAETTEIQSELDGLNNRFESIDKTITKHRNDVNSAERSIEYLERYRKTALDMLPIKVTKDNDGNESFARLTWGDLFESKPDKRLEANFWEPIFRSISRNLETDQGFDNYFTEKYKKLLANSNKILAQDVEAYDDYAEMLNRLNKQLATLKDYLAMIRNPDDAEHLLDKYLEERREIEEHMGEKDDKAIGSSKLDELNRIIGVLEAMWNDPSKLDELREPIMKKYDYLEKERDVIQTRMLNEKKKIIRGTMQQVAGSIQKWIRESLNVSAGGRMLIAGGKHPFESNINSEHLTYLIKMTERGHITGFRGGDRAYDEKLINAISNLDKGAIRSIEFNIRYNKVWQAALVKALEKLRDGMLYEQNPSREENVDAIYGLMLNRERFYRNLKESQELDNKLKSWSKKNNVDSTFVKREPVFTLIGEIELSAIERANFVAEYKVKEKELIAAKLSPEEVDEKMAEWLTVKYEELKEMKRLQAKKKLDRMEEREVRNNLKGKIFDMETEEWRLMTPEEREEAEIEKAEKKARKPPKGYIEELDMDTGMSQWRLMTPEELAAEKAAEENREAKRQARKARQQALAPIDLSQPTEPIDSSQPIDLSDEGEEAEEIVL